MVDDVAIVVEHGLGAVVVVYIVQGATGAGGNAGTTEDGKVGAIVEWTACAGAGADITLAHGHNVVVGGEVAAQGHGVVVVVVVHGHGEPVVEEDSVNPSAQGGHRMEGAHVAFHHGIPVTFLA